MLEENYSLLDLNEEVPVSAEQGIKKSSLIELYDKYIKTPIKDLLKKSEQLKLYADTLVFNNNHELLLLKRIYQDDFQAGKWCLPGGKIEEGENHHEAGIRECLEETGLLLNSVYLQTINPEGCSIDYFVAIHSDLTPILLDCEEHLNYEWVKIENLGNYDLIIGLKENLETLLASISFEEPIAALVEEKIPTYESVLQEFEYVQKSFDSNEIAEEEYFQKYNEYQNSLYLLKKGELDDKLNKGEIEDDIYLLELAEIGFNNTITLTS